MDTLYSVVMNAKEYDALMKFVAKALTEAANDPTALQVKRCLAHAVKVGQESGDKR